MLLSEIASCEIPGMLYGDNEASNYVTKNKHVSARTKHIYIYIYAITMSMSTLVMIEDLSPLRSLRTIFADALTKNVCIAMFEKCGKTILNGFKGWIDEI